jgi:hypothetical protein
MKNPLSHLALSPPVPCTACELAAEAAHYQLIHGGFWLDHRSNPAGSLWNEPGAMTRSFSPKKPLQPCQKEELTLSGATNLCLETHPML